jgi:hypothetical protein
MVGVTGATNSGKTTLFDTIKMMFGRLVFGTEKATEAGIRQGINSRSCAVFLDEFESDQHRQRILELLRTSSRGGTIARGTADQRGRVFGMKHIAWMAAIELGLTREADRNRFILLNLDRPPAATYGQMDLPGEDALADLGLRLLALAVTHAHAANKLAQKLKSHVVDGVPSRIIESYAIPAAMLASIRGLGDDGATKLLERFVVGRAFAGRVIADEKALWRDLMRSQIDIGRGERLLVSEISSEQMTYELGVNHLERVGIALVGRKGPRPHRVEDCRQFFVEVETCKRFLLRGTRWADMDLKEILLRIPGASWARRRVKSMRDWGVLIPFSAVEHGDSSRTVYSEDADGHDGLADVAPDFEVTPMGKWLDTIEDLADLPRTKLDNGTSGGQSQAA